MPYATRQTSMATWWSGNGRNAMNGVKFWLPRMSMGLKFPRPAGEGEGFQNQSVTFALTPSPPLPQGEGVNAYYWRP